jgi:GMP synthase-like glutamine amidotransferase
MEVHYLQHVPFEGLAAIEDWASSRGHPLSASELFRPLRDENAPTEPANRAVLPSPDAFDFLIIMGGPMSVDDSEKYPWLEDEKTFIRAAVDRGAVVLGICLGAQLLAAVLGGQVAKNGHPEIGWYPVTLTPAGRSQPPFSDFPDPFPALHWHGDTFSIPPEAVHLASSDACPNQAFSYDDGRAVGLQFHLEVTPSSLALLAQNASDNLTSAQTERWVMPLAELLSPTAPYEVCQKLLFGLLDRMASRK